MLSVCMYVFVYVYMCVIGILYMRLTRLFTTHTRENARNKTLKQLDVKVAASLLTTMPQCSCRHLISLTMLPRTMEVNSAHTHTITTDSVFSVCLVCIWCVFSSGQCVWCWAVCLVCVWCVFDDGQRIKKYTHPPYTQGRYLAMQKLVTFIVIVTIL